MQHLRLHYFRSTSTTKSSSLLNLRLLCPSFCRRCAPTLSSAHVIPPSEAAGVIANELFMMNIVMVCTSPEREDVVKRPGELVSGMRINGLEQAQYDPDIHGEDV